jgi:hypothetical protein
MKRNLLKELYDGNISVEQAYDIYDAAVNASVGDWAEPLELSDAEATAYAHGVGFAELARWRYEGWPNVCPICGKEIEVEKFGWWAKEIDEGHRLVHITCLPGPTEEEKQVRDEFQPKAVPGFYNHFERDVALSFVERAAQLNLAVALVQGITIRDGRVQEAPKDLMRSCWDEVEGDTWREFRDQCFACADRFLRAIPPREGLAFDFELDPEEKWPKLKARREEIRREREERSPQA